MKKCLNKKNRIWKQISAMSMALCVAITSGCFNPELAQAETNTENVDKMVDDTIGFTEGKEVSEAGTEEGQEAFRCVGDNEINPSLIDNLKKTNSDLGLEEGTEDNGIALLQMDPISNYHITPATGDINTLVIMVDFSDVKFDEAFSHEFVQELMFADQDEKSDKFPFESLRAYYQRSSFGKLNISGDIVDVHLNYTKEEYTAGDNYTEDSPELTEDVWKDLRERGIDWEQYDSDNDHYVDSICMIVAGAEGEWASQWWSKCLYGNAVPMDEKEEYHVGEYALCMEGQMKKSDTIIHEFGHMLGLPDLYNSYNSNVEEGIHTSDMMCQNIGDLNGLCKMLLGWLDESQIHIVKYGENASGLQLRSYAETGDIALFMVNEGESSLFSEYYLAEYYTPYGNDSYIDISCWESTYPARYVRFFHVNAELSEDGKYLAHDNYSTGNDDDCLLIQAVDRDAQYIHGYDFWELLYPKRVIWRANMDRKPEIYCGYVDGDMFTPYTTPSTNKYALDRLKNSTELFSGLSVTNIKCTENYASLDVSYEETANAEETLNLTLEAYNAGRKSAQISSNFDIYVNDTTVEAYIREKETKAYVEDITISTNKIWPGWTTVYPYHAAFMIEMTDPDKILDGVQYEAVLPEGMFITAFGMELEETVFDIGHSHKLELVEAKAATCQNKGNIEYWNCKGCGKAYKDENGTEEYKVDEILIDQDPANHIGSTYIKGYVEPTETTEGYSGDTYCQGCDSLLEKGTVIPATGILAQGDCGDNLTWSLTKEGVLHIDGTGAMNSYAEPNESAPWKAYRDSITSVVIGDGVTSIGDYAFAFDSNLRQVSLSSGITSIGEFAFILCSALEEINLPETLLEIKMYAFCGCEKLETIEIPSGATLGAYAFANCGFKKIELPSGTEKISEGLFAGCASLEESPILPSVKEIGAQAFTGCENLRKIEIPDGVKSIAFGTFSNCTSLEEIRIPSSVEEIGQLSFAGCSSLKYVIIPKTVESIGRHALGYTSGNAKEDNFIIFGEKGSAAETYAEENELSFKESSELNGDGKYDNHLKVFANDSDDDFYKTNVTLGSSVKLSVWVEADNVQNLQYSWYYQNSNGEKKILDSINDACIVEDIKKNSFYYCDVTDYYGNTITATFCIGIENHLKVYGNGQEESTVVKMEKGGTAELKVTVTADNDSDLKYSWYCWDCATDITTKLDRSDSQYLVVDAQKYLEYYCTVEDCYGNLNSVRFDVFVNTDQLTANESEASEVDITANKGDDVVLTVRSKEGKEKDYTYSWLDYKIDSDVELSETSNICTIHNIQENKNIRVNVTDPEYGNTYFLYYYISVKEKTDDSKEDDGNIDADKPDSGSTSGGTTDTGSTGGTTGGTTDTGSTGGTTSGGGVPAGGGATGGTATGNTGATASADKKDGSAKTDKTVTTSKNADGSVKEVVKEKETNSKGKEVMVTTITITDKKGKVTSTTEKTKIDNITTNATATVTVKTDKKGKVTATASIEKSVANEKNSATISSAMIEQVKEAAGTDVDITMTVKDKDGNTKYKVKADTADLKEGKTLYIYKRNAKTGEYEMVNDKIYSVNKEGNVSVNLDDKGTFELLSEKEAESVEKKILNTVKVKKSKANIKKGKKTKVTFSKKLNMENVENITYTTDSDDVATVSKKGTITAKGKGTTTVSATVTLKNGKKKKVTMKLTVK